MRLLQYKYMLWTCVCCSTAVLENTHLVPGQDWWATDHELILAKNSRLIVSVAAFWITPENPLYITNMLLYYSRTPLNDHPWFAATLSIADTNLGSDCIAIQNSTLPILVGQRERGGCRWGWKRPRAWLAAICQSKSVTCSYVKTLTWALRFRSPVIEFFTLELFLCQRGNPCWKKSTLKPNYSAVATDQCNRPHLQKLELTTVEFNLAVFLLNRQTAKLNSPNPIPAVLWLYLKYYKTCALT